MPAAAISRSPVGRALKRASSFRPSLEQLEDRSQPGMMLSSGSGTVALDWLGPSALGGGFFGLEPSFAIVRADLGAKPVPATEEQEHLQIGPSGWSATGASGQSFAKPAVTGFSAATSEAANDHDRELTAAAQAGSFQFTVVPTFPGEAKEGGNNGPQAPGTTIVRAPGEYPIPPGSVIFVSNRTVLLDAWQLWWDAPSGTPIHEGIANWADFRNRLQNYPDGSISSIVISGHGAEGGGVATNGDDVNNWLTGDNIDDETANLIRRKLKGTGEIIFAACDQGVDFGDEVHKNQRLADRTLAPVIGNMGDVNSGTNGQGDWVRFPPPRN